MPASGYEILKSAKLCAKIANLCAKIAKWVSGDVGVLGVLAVQRLLTRQKDLPDPSLPNCGNLGYSGPEA